jgi:hypothetical protein
MEWKPPPGGFRRAAILSRESGHFKALRRHFHFPSNLDVVVVQRD